MALEQLSRRKIGAPLPKRASQPEAERNAKALFRAIPELRGDVPRQEMPKHHLLFVAAHLKSSGRRRANEKRG